jgi:hypothetical protein
MQAFVLPGECYAACQAVETCPIPPNTPLDQQLELIGYDGQFAYFIARDLTGAASCLDVPAYRYQRILLPLLAWPFSVLGEVYLPGALLLINSLALLTSTYLLEDLLRMVGRSPWWALVYGLFAGLLFSVRLSTPEALAYAWAVAAIWTYQGAYRFYTPPLLLLAAFSKETTLILTAGFMLHALSQKDGRFLAALVGGVGLPFLLWQGFLAWHLGEPGLASGGAGATGFETIPFMGILKIGTEGNWREFWARGVIFLGGAVVFPSLWALYQTGREFWRPGGISFYGALLLTTAAVMPFLPFSTYREYLGILRFMPPLVLMLLLYSAAGPWERALRYSTLWLSCLLFLGVG